MPGSGGLLTILTYVLAVGLGFAMYFVLTKIKVSKANVDATKIVEEATAKADNIVKEAILDAKTQAYEYKLEAEKEIKEQRLEVTKFENKLLQREQNIDRRDIALQGKEDVLDDKAKQLEKRSEELGKLEAQLKEQIDAKIVELEKIAAMSANEAKEELFKQVEQKMATEVTAYIKEKEDEAKSKASLYAKDIIAAAINRYSQEETIERTVNVVALPSEEMKGRIIGREGRNIKAIENATGVELIIDDTPEAITISCFDPVRREIARLSLETLIRDGRIQPGRIEEVVQKTKNELNEVIQKTGEDAIFELGLSRVNKEIIMMLGKLKYRTSYGQNALQHSLEVAHFAGMMAAELGLNQQLARRAGLLHDLGKAVDHEMEGSHVELGAKFAKKYGENATVVNAIESHHGDVEATSVISILVAAADTLSAARPGSRSETIENYIQRLEKLEEISKSFDGVDKVFAIQAGREVRVIVKPDKVDDLASHKLAREIKNKIETELTYPGHIKVTVIREVRANEIAK
ncbi:MAG: ribonuclease Y [Coprobacillus cateniformis]|uniref:ribonuclease Y n=1 Tax=Longibaculum muris TaxID=1796628 RepID=UPI00082E8A0F|nr:ribonuclease Y [Longibaculum muris]MBS5113348.1 ribonuclease Y [Coprobacillus cateniformis]MBS5368985.1 ribonuclease Y [Coprobacillus cateniformis]MED9811364.1 ribonuclease Y [Longibaculum muris]